VAIIFLLLLLGSALLTYLFTNSEYSFASALFESGSAQGTVGLSSGITDPSMSPFLELIYIFQMWTGRLEIIPVFVLFRAIIRGTNSRII
jgi:trk system potassium uptake protein TrkH